MTQPKICAIKQSTKLNEITSKLVKNGGDMMKIETHSSFRIAVRKNLLKSYRLQLHLLSCNNIVGKDERL